MKNNKSKYFILFISTVVFLSIISISVAIFSNSSNDKSIDKAKEEINYMDSKLLGMLNSLNNIPFSNAVIIEQAKTKENENEKKNDSQNQEENSSEKSENKSESKTNEYSKYNVSNDNLLIEKSEDIDWNYIKNTTTILYQTWPTIMIDLHALNVKNEDILNFSNNLDILIINIENEDKINTMKTLCVLYNYLPIFMEQFQNENFDKYTLYTKADIINAYVLLEEDKWDDIQNQIINADNHFENIINSNNFDKKNKSYISKSYVLINEMKNIINYKNKKLFYIKYKNLMESIMKI